MTELDDFRASLRAFLTVRNPVERTLEVIEHRQDKGHHDPVLWKEMARLGLQGIAVPERYGGAGAGRPELAVVFEESAAALVTEPLLATAGLAVPALLEGGDEASREEFLPAIASGALTATVVPGASGTGASGTGASEAEPSGVRASGVTLAGGATLHGVAPFVLDGAVADLVLVEADTAVGPALFAVTGGFDRVPLDVLDPTRGMARLEFRGTPARRIGVGGTGRATVLLAVAAEQLGVAQRCLDLSVDYAKVRVQFGRPIGSFQAVKHLCANMLLEVELARSAVEHATGDGAHGGSDGGGVDLAHAFCADTGVRVAGDCIQVHGGIGYTWEHPAHLYLKRAKTNQHLFGGTRPTRRRLAERIGA